MNSKTKTGLVSLTVVAALLGLGAWWFFSGDEPAEVNLDVATKSVNTRASTTSSPSGDGATPTADSTAIDGTWSVDTETGDFDYESATGTFAGFRVEEELAKIGSATAVGRTGDVTGTITIEKGRLTDAEITIDMSTITTNEPRRDNRVKSALEIREFPTATFRLSKPVKINQSAIGGRRMSATATGELTIHGVAKKASFDLEAQLVDDTIVVVASTRVVFSDFDVKVPTAPVVLSVDDHGSIEMQLLFIRK